MEITNEEMEQIKREKQIRGFFEKDGELYLDLRYIPEVADRLGLSPRTRDMNIIGADVVRVTLIDDYSDGSAVEGDV